MSFRQVYVKKEVWPKVILKRLSVSLTHPFKCTRCKQRFHKIHEAKAHYLNTHQNSNDLLDKEIPANETKIEIDSQIKNEVQTGIKEEVKFETEVQRGLKILEKFDVLKEISQEPNENQEAKSPHEKVRENEDMQLENSENEVAKGNEKFGEFDLLKIEEANIDFSEGEIETDYLVHAHSVIEIE